MATGVLVVGVGRATRLLGHLTLTDKAYDATVRLGTATTTDDAEGEVVAEHDTGDVAEDEVRSILAGMVGEIEQVPSAVSAVKIEGRRAYQRVRAGEDVELPARRVRIDAIDVTRVALPDLDLSVRCSSGTYVRAIARDLGAALGVGAHLTALRRTAVGPFALEQARTLDELAADFVVVPLTVAARAGFPSVDLGAEDATAVRFGRRLDRTLPADGPVALFDPDGDFLALYEQRGTQAAAIAVFVGQ
jgi:tRNA pseudouridine55 synthase